VAVRYLAPARLLASRSLPAAAQKLRHYQLGPFVVMANHVHLLLLPLAPPSHLLKSLKGSTADHWVRDEGEWNRIAAYIENNPVKAGLVTRAEGYPWPSARGVARSGDAARKVRAPQQPTTSIG
jgi:REP element-mobilizing transposase RayT